MRFVSLFVLWPALVLAHGGGGGAEIDEHHAALRDRLQAELGDAYDEPVAGLDSADLENGAALYAMHCQSCHGSDGVGDGPAASGLSVPPSDLTDGVQMGFISDAGFMEVIRSGLTETGMPAYGELIDTTDQVDLYAYTKTLRVTPAKEEHHCAARPGANDFPALPILAAVGVWVFTRRQR